MRADKLFGTDGIRGTPGEYPLTDGMLFKIGKGCARLLFHNRAKNYQYQPRIVIGNDTRISCYQIETFLTSGITSCGVDVLLAGTIPTPGLAFLTTLYEADMGLMISASHNRPEDNGIKFFSHSGHKLSEKEEEIMENIIFNTLLNFNEPAINKIGFIHRAEDSRKKYSDFLKSSVPDLDLSGFKIVVDCGNGAVSHIAPELFRNMGAEVFSAGDKPNGTNINVGYGVLHPETISEFVTREGADIGFAFDGDGDRLILADEKGNVLDGDYIMAITGIHMLKHNRLSKNTVVATVMSNWGLEEAIQGAGGRLIRTSVGDKYILETMRKQGLVLGGEQSGHIIFLEHSTTGDAMITALQILKVMKETNKKLSRLSQCMSKLPQVLINVGVRQKRPFDSISRIAQAISYSNARLKGNGRLLVRYSGTEPVARIMVEGRDQQLIQEVANFIADAIKENLGFSVIGAAPEKREPSVKRSVCEG